MPKAPELNEEENFPWLRLHLRKSATQYQRSASLIQFISIFTFCRCVDAFATQHYKCHCLICASGSALFGSAVVDPCEVSLILVSGFAFYLTLCLCFALLALRVFLLQRQLKLATLVVTSLTVLAAGYVTATWLVCCYCWLSLPRSWEGKSALP